MHFDEKVDKHNLESIQMLKEAGLDFNKHASQGISHDLFATQLRKTTLLKNKKLTWVAFNSCFDFAYLIKSIEESLIDNKTSTSNIIQAEKGSENCTKLPGCQYEFL